MTAMSENPWWHPRDDDLDWDEPLPSVVVLAPDYGAELPLWGGGFGYNIDWRFTQFPPALLDRWAHQAKILATDVRAALGTRAKLIVDLWPVVEEASG
jgi:hypothetical protein